MMEATRAQSRTLTNTSKLDSNVPTSKQSRVESVSFNRVENVVARPLTIALNFTLSALLVAGGAALLATGIGGVAGLGLLLGGVGVASVASIGSVLKGIKEYRSTKNTETASFVPLPSYTETETPFVASPYLKTAKTAYDEEIDNKKIKIKINNEDIKPNKCGVISFISDLNKKVTLNFIKAENAEIHFIGFSKNDENIIGKAKKAYANIVADDSSVKHSFGSSKIMMGKEEGFVQLILHGSPDEEGLESIKNKFNLELLSDLQSVAKTYAISETHYIAADAGNSLFNYIAEEEKSGLTIDCFKQTLLDLDVMHKKGIFVADICPENLAIKAGDSMVRFIDTDSMYHPNYVAFKCDAPVIGIKDFYTTGTLKSALKDRHYQIGQDLYAMLMTMLEVTGFSYLTPRGRDILNVGLSDVDIEKLTWLQQKFLDTHVKPKYHKIVTTMMDSPKECIDNLVGKNIALPSLYEVFLFCDEDNTLL